MKFTNGYWMIRDGVDALYAREAYELAADATTESLNVLAPTSVVRGRYDTLNLPTFNVDITTPAEGVIRVCRTLARRHRIPRIPAQCRRTRQP
jgi:alpha-D-xyloside xylohydrolase